MTFRLTAFVFLRLLGGVYFIAFLSLAWQLLPLLGAQGLLPAHSLLLRNPSFSDLPTLFQFADSDTALLVAAWCGVVLSAAVAAGLTNAVAMAALWALYLSFVHVGQIFLSYGWEILLLETGLLAIFLCPLRTLRPLPAAAPSPIPIFLLRWVLFRVMFGAGLIKLRGGACWRDLTCLLWHYETQPLPNPMSWLLHQAPPWLQAAGVLWNHFIELVVPLFLFWPRRIATVAGALQIAFQISLLLSGNLSFFNWLTLTLALCCFDDRTLGRLFPPRYRLPSAAPPWRRQLPQLALALIVAGLSTQPIANMISPYQLMNSSFDRLHVVNTYGAFGSVGQTRNEVILEGSDDGTTWRAYELPCQPGDPRRRPCFVAPWQWRLDWQIWFAAMSTVDRQPWLVHLVDKLLRNDRRVLALFANDPFPDHPPRLLRAELYEYHFTRFGEPGWWRRERVDEYMKAVTLDDPALVGYLRAVGLRDP